MATTNRPWTQYLKPQTEVCGPVQCVKGDPKHTVPVPYHESLKNDGHTVFQVQGPVSPVPKEFSVNIFNSSNGIKIPVTVSSTDTIWKLKQKVLAVNPDFGEDMSLIFNGKPVLLCQTLCELWVKPGATFLTYQKCYGGGKSDLLDF